MKRSLALMIVLCITLLPFASALAAVKDEIAPMADSIIATANVSLNSSGVASFSVTVYEKAGTIRVKSCRLQKYDNGWVNAGTLSVPSYVATNLYIYSTTKDYSSYCSDGGKYRIIVTFNVDGYTKSYTSNSVSY